MNVINRVVFQLTRRCNLACPHCFFDGGPEAGEMIGFDEANKALSDLRLLGIKKVNVFVLTGGEPTLWPQIIGLIANIRKEFPNSKIRLDTNGLEFFYNQEKFGIIGADIYDISVDAFHNQGAPASVGGIFVNSDGSSPLVDVFIKNREKYGFEFFVRWTSDRRDEQLFSRFYKKYGDRVKIEKKLVTATGRGAELPGQKIDSGYLIKENEKNFSCLMGDSFLLAIDGFWYGCYHPVGLTRLGKAGDEAIVKKFKKLISSDFYKNLSKKGLIKFLEEMKKKNPEKSKAIDEVLGKRYWYRCEPCEDLNKKGVFKL